jgi:DNA polymerase III subunit alpha, Gram-positive type
MGLSLDENHAKRGLTMDKHKFDLFLEQSKFSSNTLNSALLMYVLVDPSQKAWHFHIKLKQVVESEVLEPFIQQIKTYFYVPKIVLQVYVHLSYEDLSQFKDYAIQYYEHVLYLLCKEKASFLVFKNFEVTYEDDTFYVHVDKDSVYIKNNFKEFIKMFKTYGFDVSLKMQIEEKLTPIGKVLETSIQEQNAMLEAQVQVRKESIKKDNINKFRSKRSSAQAVSIKEIPVDQYQLDKYKNEKGDTYFVLEGTIGKIEVRSLSNSNSDLLTFLLADQEDAIYVKQFMNSKNNKDFAQALKDGDYVQVEGEAMFDMYQKDVVIRAKTINYLVKSKKEERMDKAKEKRIELHLHTKMSNMDGVTDVYDYVDRALKWGHEAIAFTDHNGLYAYPDIYKATRGKDIKAIYGVELDFVDEIAFQMTSKVDLDQSLKDLTYVVFDIETTGLSSTRDHIIEIGAVKISQGAIVDRFQAFVNPKIELSEFTKNHTGITDDMLNDQDTIDQVLPRFLAFSKNACYVAHNALFDIGHIRENAKRLGLVFEDPLVVDTIHIARYFYSDQIKRFNLKALSRLFKVKLEQHHRADQDAEATAQIWLQMIADLQMKNIRYFKDINLAIDPNESYKHIMPYHVNVLVKNQKGYHHLFKIISDALTTHFYQGARTLKSVLETYREGLLVGSGCYKGDVFEIALNRDDEALEKAITYYDYIEVQPPQAYKHLMTGLGENGKEIIEGVIRRIISFAKKQNKLVIATGDVHYLEKQDVLYREIYIRTPLVGGGIHDLKNYDEMPEQYFLTTEEMLKSMSFLGEKLAYEIVVTNTNQLNQMIEPIKAFPSQLYSLPDHAFKNQLGIESIADEVKRLVFDNMQHKYGQEPHLIVVERVHRELKNIIENEFAPIYYMSHLLVKKSLEDGYLVGSRGSVGSSLVATLLDITEVNPLRPHYRCKNGDFTAFYINDDEIPLYGLSKEQKMFQPFLKGVQAGYDLPNKDCPVCGQRLFKDGHDIPFETFLGFDGDKVPDIDLNFSGDYQQIAHQYVRELLGEDHTFRAGTIQTVAERNAYGYVKGYLEDKNLNVRSAQIERLAKHIEGVKRSTGQHPGGIVVVPKNKTIYDVTPIQFPADDITSEWKTTHFDYHSFEANLLKLDILGHDDPTMIKFLMDYVKEHPEKFTFQDAKDIPLDDEDVYKLFESTKIIDVKPDDILSDVASYAIPEFGTPFTRQMLMDIKPNTFANLVKVSGLSHGENVWLKNAQSLINNQTDFGKIDFNDIIACRDDIMVQLTKMGLEPIKAFEIMEFVRRGRPSKDMVKWLEYENEMRKHKVPEWYIWSASQIKYMFPKAHATAYVIMAMRIAWFKIHEPLLFYSGFFSKRAVQFDYETMVSGSNAIRNRMKEFENEPYNRKVKDEQLIVTLGVALEMTKRGFKFLPVDIYQSEAAIFKMEKEGLRMPFITIDGLGAQVAEDIVFKRDQKMFTSQKDVKERTKINNTIFIKLEQFGAFKDLIDENDVIDAGLFALDA